MSALNRFVFVALLIAAGLACDSAPASAATGTTKGIGSTLEGERASVWLVSVRRLPSNDAGAPAALEFTFAITRKPGASGPFSLSELRDCEVRGKSYAARTLASTGRAFEPKSVIEDADQVAHGEGTIVDALAVPSSDAIVMITRLFGETLPASGEIQVTPRVGWGEKLESFAFRFDLANVR